MTQPASELISLLREHRLRIFRTTDFQTLTGLKRPAAVHALRRLAGRKLIVRIKRGIWANLLIDDLDPMEAVPHLISPWPGYVSLYSALSRSGSIEEVPHKIFAVSAGRPARYRTKLGDFDIHHLPGKLIWGFKMERAGRATVPMAEPEKAFLDLAYLGLIPRSKISLPYKRDGRWPLNRTKLAQYATRFKFRPLLAYLKNQFDRR